MKRSVGDTHIHTHAQAWRLYVNSVTENTHAHSHSHTHTHTHTRTHRLHHCILERVCLCVTGHSRGHKFHKHDERL